VEGRTPLWRREATWFSGVCQEDSSSGGVATGLRIGHVVIAIIVATAEAFLEEAKKRGVHGHGIEVLCVGGREGFVTPFPKGYGADGTLATLCVLDRV
jgi:hypothetical protein